MRILLDTHIYLWWERNDKNLPKIAVDLISAAQEVYVSSVSIWEIAIKKRVKKFEADLDALMEGINKYGLIELPVTSKHAEMIYHLPLLHKDPFDHLLLAQAISEPLRFLTTDKMLRQYSDIVDVV
jgi:PIN domain nuclease of toxin-antitoxin system